MTWTGTEIVHKDGVAWNDAPAPKRRHKHFAQTSGFIGFKFIQRCPCGAMGDHRGWVLLDKPRVAKRWWQV